MAKHLRQHDAERNSDKGRKDGERLVFCRFRSNDRFGFIVLNGSLRATKTTRQGFRCTPIGTSTDYATNDEFFLMRTATSCLLYGLQK